LRVTLELLEHLDENIRRPDQLRVAAAAFEPGELIAERTRRSSQSLLGQLQERRVEVAEQVGGDGWGRRARGDDAGLLLGRERDVPARRLFGAIATRVAQVAGHEELHERGGDVKTGRRLGAAHQLDEDALLELLADRGERLGAEMLREVVVGESAGVPRRAR